jgi:single-strand DNA-binding protein
VTGKAGKMAKGLNKVMLIGRLGKDPDCNFTGSGTAVCKFSVATSDEWTDKQGEKQEKTEWHKIVAWGKLGEICGNYLKKGSQVYIEGKIVTRSWEKDGITRYTTEIVASDMQMLDSKKQENNSGSVPGEEYYRENKPGANQGPPDDDIPF